MSTAPIATAAGREECARRDFKAIAEEHGTSPQTERAKRRWEAAVKTTDRVIAAAERRAEYRG